MSKTKIGGNRIKDKTIKYYHLADGMLGKTFLTIDADKQTNFNIPFTKDLENYIIVAVNSVVQIKDIDYQLSFTDTTSELIWISKDFDLETVDRFTVELGSRND